MVRRTIGFALTVVLMLFAGYQLAWHKDEMFSTLSEHPIGSIAFLALVVLTAVVGAWCWNKPTKPRVAIAFGLGILCALFGRTVLDGVSWWFLFWMFVGIALLGILWVFTTWQKLPAWVPFFGAPAPATAPAAPAPAPAPAPVP